jgi:Tol biopolymer transport system component
MDADGRNMRKLTDQRGLHPAWSADGSQIAYEGPAKEGTGIWVINADGSEGQMISEEGRHPDWSK